MAAADARCWGCGRPLEGRDRFEGKCPACREAEILGRALPAEAGGGASPTPWRPARVWLAALLAAAALAAAAAAVFLWPRGSTVRPAGRTGVVSRTPRPGTATEPARPLPAPVPLPAARKAVPADVRAPLQQETIELLGLVGRGSYDRVIDNYVQPDEADFGRTERALDNIVRGGAATGFAAWAARIVRLREAKVAEDLRRVGDTEADFTAAFLAFLVREPGASDAATSSEDRARSLLRWHLAALFEGLVARADESGEMAAVGPGCFEVALACGGERRARWLRAEPTRLRWRKLPVGWVLKLGLADRLEHVRDILKQPVPGESASPP